MLRNSSSAASSVGAFLEAWSLALLPSLTLAKKQTTKKTPTQTHTSGRRPQRWGEDEEQEMRAAADPLFYICPTVTRPAVQGPLLRLRRRAHRLLLQTLICRNCPTKFLVSGPVARRLLRWPLAAAFYPKNGGDGSREAGERDVSGCGAQTPLVSK